MTPTLYISHDENTEHFYCWWIDDDYDHHRMPYESTILKRVTARYPAAIVNQRVWEIDRARRTATT